VGGGIGALAAVSALSYLNLNATAATGWPLAITDGCCTFVGVARPYCFGKASATAACVAFVQTTALLAFKASGGAANDAPLASWRSGTDPCGGACAGVNCSGGAAPTVTGLDLSDYSKVDMAGDIGALAPLVQLTWLRLFDTKVTGDVKGLAPLVQLTVLDLTLTKVTGQAAALAPLVRLTRLWLEGTAVAGCGAFCAAGGPFHTFCDPTNGSSNCGCYCSRGARGAGRAPKSPGEHSPVRRP
jgi:hypothetical protein